MSKKYYTMFKKAYEFHQKKFDEYAESVAYYELDQDKIKSNAAKPWVYQINTPFATDAINIRVASLQASDYTGELEPLSPEDIETVKVLNSVQKEVWQSMNMDNNINDAILQAAVVGESYTHILFDADTVKGGTGRKNVGSLSSYFIDAASVHIDPKALSLDRANYVCISERYTASDIQINYPNFDLADLKVNSDPNTRGEIYAGGDYTPEDDDKIYTKVTIYEKNKKGTIDKTVILEEKILEKTETLPIRVFPIAQMIWQNKIKSPYGTSLMSMLLPLQKVLNEIESANANANMQYSSPSFLISEDSGIDPEEFAMSAGAPGVAYVISSGVRLDDAVKPLLSDRGIDEGLVITKQELERSIYKLAGINEAFQGQLGTAGNTSTGADMTIQRAKTIEQRIITNIEKFVEQLTLIVVEYISTGFAGETVYSRGEQETNGNWNFKQYDIPEDAENIDYSFYIELNVRTNYSKEQQKAQLIETYQMERQYDTGDVKAITTPDVLKAMNIPQIEHIIARYDQTVKMDNEQKAQLITELITVAQELGMDAELTNAAIAEVIASPMQTPVLDEFMMQAEQMRVQLEQEELAVTQAAQQAQMQQFTDEEALNNMEFGV